jgi:hypothetical protein
MEFGHESGAACVTFSLRALRAPAKAAASRAHSIGLWYDAILGEVRGFLLEE